MIRLSTKEIRRIATGKGLNLKFNLMPVGHADSGRPSLCGLPRTEIVDDPHSPSSRSYYVLSDGPAGLGLFSETRHRAAMRGKRLRAKKNVYISPSLRYVRPEHCERI
ncbi:hypothetical protein [Bradyrhizobium zhanjiangense]|uniref:hypothetical protein n=1 Tax=Bradyrhizobium zhanjiangense TaxID=1325107 RepID=UPI001008AB75|nr:hypothetical protein [Bradyrhizobium zhanjiangense]